MKARLSANRFLLNIKSIKCTFMPKFFSMFSKYQLLVARCVAQSVVKVKRSAILVDPLWLLLVALMFLLGCGGGAGVSSHSSGESEFAAITVLPKTASVVVGATLQYQAIAQDQHGNTIPGVEFAFTSSGTAAIVDSNGLAKGLSVGTAKITATAAGKSASVSLAVASDTPSAMLTKISVSPSTASIQAGQQQTYTAVGYDQFNKVMNGITFDWASDGSTAIAMLNGNVATGVAPGTIHITASASGIVSAPASLTVLPPPPALATIMLTPSSPTILIGGNQQLTATGLDQNGMPMTGITFAWTSSNQNVATVNATGSASGLTVGTSQITASALGVHSNAVVLTVNQPPSVLTSISVTPTTASVQAGSTQEFSAVGYDQYQNVMSGITFGWSSSNPSVASVTAINAEGKTDGVATGIAAGSTQITASANGVSASVSLTVTAPPPPPPPPTVTTINVTSANGTITVGGTQQFSALATDQNGNAMSGVTFTWISSDPTVATVDATGLATGIAIGTVQIGASAQSVNSNGVSLAVISAPCDCPITLTRLSPSMALVGSGDLIPLTITGTGFVTGALVNFGSNILTPTSVSPTTIVVTVPAAELTSVTPTDQPLAVTVTNPAPNAGTSDLCLSALRIMDLFRSILMTDISPCTTTGYRSLMLRDSRARSTSLRGRSVGTRT